MGYFSKVTIRIYIHNNYMDIHLITFDNILIKYIFK